MYLFDLFNPLLQSGLSDAELESLDNVYRNTYVAKYPIAGYMDYLHEELSKKSKHELWYSQILF